MLVNISLGPLAQHDNLNLQHRIRCHHGRRQARELRRGAPLHAHNHHSSPEAAWERQCRHPGGALPRELPQNAGGVRSDITAGGRDRRLRLDIHGRALDRAHPQRL